MGNSLSMGAATGRGELASATTRLDAFQQRHPTIGFPLATAYKFFDDQGPYLAALIAYYGFLSLFPLLLLLTSTLGFVLQHDADLQRRILESTLAQFPVIGDELGRPQGLRGSTGALVTGSLVALYGALGVAQAVQNALNTAWAVPRNRRANPLRARVRSLLLIGVGGIATLATTVLTALVGTGSAFGSQLGGWRMLAAVLASVVVNSGVFVLVFWISTTAKRRPGDVVPGALVAAFVWQLLQVFGTAYVGSVVKNNGSTYGVFALVLGLLGWIFLAGIGIVLGAEVNVVRARKLYPRALLTPFTDDVDLTPADQRSYAGAAEAQRFKGFETVEVSFEHDGQFATARRIRPDHDDDEVRRPSTRRTGR